jgi:hypothetical protein
MSFAHQAVLTLLFLVFGGCVGSFLNVCVYRLPRGLSLLRPRSHCPRCRAPVRARDNVPVLGWLFLRGRCRECVGAISPRYPLVELATGVAFAGVYLAWIKLAHTDVWEQAGALGVLLRLLVFWSLIGIALTAALIVYDSHGRVSFRRLQAIPQRECALDRSCELDEAAESHLTQIAVSSRASTPPAPRCDLTAPGPSHPPSTMEETPAGGRGPAPYPAARSSEVG